MKKGFVARLIDGRDSSADSIIVCAVMLSAGLIAISAWDVAREHHVFSPTGFGTAAGTILATLGAGKAVRAYGSAKADAIAPAAPLPAQGE